MRRALAVLLALPAVTLMSAPGVQAGETIRIEPRPVYGATVTLEEGVRVFRPLPPDRRVIVNPGNAPISLGFNETYINEHRTVTNYWASSGPSSYGGRFYGGFANGGRYGWKPGHGGHRGVRSGGGAPAGP